MGHIHNTNRGSYFYKHILILSHIKRMKENFAWIRRFRSLAMNFHTAASRRDSGGYSYSFNEVIIFLIDIVVPGKSEDTSVIHLFGVVKNILMV